MDFWEKLGSVDNRVIYVLLILSLMIPLINPLGLPVSVGPYTQKSFAMIDALQPGDKIMVDIGYSVSGASDVEPQAIAVVKHLMTKNIKVLFVGCQPEGGMITENIMKPYASGKKYGEDWANLGYLAPGGETAISAYAQDIKKAYPKDFRGNPTESLPILDGVKVPGDFKVFIFFTTQNSDMYVRQITPQKVPVIGGLISTISLQAEPYVQSGQLAAILTGLRGGAEYEVVMKQPGLGVASMDAQSMGHMLIIAFILMANVSYFVTRSRGDKKGASR